MLHMYNKSWLKLVHAKIVKVNLFCVFQELKDKTNVQNLFHIELKDLNSIIFVVVRQDILKNIEKSASSSPL